jgi:hypothetical protein
MAGALLLCASGAADAGSFAPAGDLGLRHDVQLLADYGVVRSTMTSWPLSWNTLAADLGSVADLDALPPAIRATVRRVQARVDRATSHGISFGAHLGVSEKPTPIRGFQYVPREDVEGGAGIRWLSDRFVMDLRVTGVDNASDGKDIRADGSEIGVRLGNFTYAVSVTDRWWGPGWDGSLILSNSARPIPAITMRRDVLSPFETKWLSWLGPWDFRMMWGEMESDRAVPNPNFFGMRFNFRPLPSLEIGISRTAQMCGEGRPCDLETFWNMLIGNDNVVDDGIGPPEDPSNQLAGIDFRWSNTWFGVPMAIYAQGIGEDEADRLPTSFIVQGGVELTTWVKASGTSFRWFAEFAGTTLGELSDKRFNSAYNHVTYRSGYRYRGRIVGHGADNDGRIGSLGMVMATDSGNHFSVLVRSGELNRGGAPDPRHSLTATPLDILSADLTYAHNIGAHRFEAGIGYEELEDPANGTKTDDARGFLRWVYNP